MSLMYYYLNLFCDQLNEAYFSVFHITPSCAFLMNSFYINLSKMNSTPTANFFSINYFGIVMVILWVFLMVLMILRVLFVVDFQLVRVSVTLVKRHNQRLIEYNHPALGFQYLTDIRKASFKSYISDDTDQSSNVSRKVKEPKSGKLVTDLRKKVAAQSVSPKRKNK